MSVKMQKGRSRKCSVAKIKFAKLKSTCEQVKSCLRRFNTVYVLTHDDQNYYLPNNIHMKWMPSRFICNTLDVLGKALEVSCEKPEYMDDFKKLILKIGPPGILLFSDLSKGEVIKRLKAEYVENYRTNGAIATIDYVLTKGPHREIPMGVAKVLRKVCGVPTTNEQGVVTLLKDFEVCRKGLPLSRSQYRILKRLRVELPRKSLRVRGCWSREKGFEPCFGSSFQKEQPLTNETQPVFASNKLDNVETFHFVDDDIDDIY